jgi:hypothetical protein
MPVLSSEGPLAELRSQLPALRQAGGEGGIVQLSPDAAQEVWRPDLDQSEDARRRECIDTFGFDPNNSSEARVMRLKGYGNAIVAPAAVAWIETVMEVVDE